MKLKLINLKRLIHLAIIIMREVKGIMRMTIMIIEGCTRKLMSLKIFIEIKIIPKLDQRRGRN